MQAVGLECPQLQVAVAFLTCKSAHLLVLIGAFPENSVTQEGYTFLQAPFRMSHVAKRFREKTIAEFCILRLK